MWLGSLFVIQFEELDWVLFVIEVLVWEIMVLLSIDIIKVEVVC